MIRKASTDEYDKVLSFYYKLIDDMKEKPYHPKWQKGIYPNSDDILRGLQSAELFVYEDDGEIIAAMKVNHAGSEGYENISWAVDATAEEISVIHILGVAVDRQGQGIARQMVRFVLERAKADGQKAVRLDVLVGNIPAKRLYESCGFEYRDKVTLFYEDTGVTDFEIYEFVF